jgi:hypothetical protein
MTRTTVFFSDRGFLRFLRAPPALLNEDSQPKGMLAMAIAIAITFIHF